MLIAKKVVFKILIDKSVICILRVCSFIEEWDVSCNFHSLLKEQSTSALPLGRHNNCGAALDSSGYCATLLSVVFLALFSITKLSSPVISCLSLSWHLKFYLMLRFNLQNVGVTISGSYKV